MIPLPVGGVPVSRTRLAAVALIFTIGAVSAGLTMGFLIGNVSGYVIAPMPQWRMVLATIGALVALVYGIAQLLDVQLRVSTRHCGVPKNWIRGCD